MPELGKRPLRLSRHFVGLLAIKWPPEILHDLEIGIELGVGRQILGDERAQP